MFNIFLVIKCPDSCVDGNLLQIATIYVLTISEMRSLASLNNSICWVHDLDTLVEDHILSSPN